MNQLAHIASRLSWPDRLALFTAIPILAGMLLLFGLTIIASGGLGVGRYVAYFGVLTLEVELLVVGTLWVAATLVRLMFGSMHARATRPRQPARAKQIPIGSFRG